MQECIIGQQARLGLERHRLRPVGLDVGQPGVVRTPHEWRVIALGAGQGRVVLVHAANGAEPLAKVHDEVVGEVRRRAGRQGHPILVEGVGWADFGDGARVGFILRITDAGEDVDSLVRRPQRSESQAIALPAAKTDIGHRVGGVVVAVVAIAAVGAAFRLRASLSATTGPEIEPRTS